MGEGVAKNCQRWRYFVISNNRNSYFQSMIFYQGIKIVNIFSALFRRESCSGFSSTRTSSACMESVWRIRTSASSWNMHEVDRSTGFWAPAAGSVRMFSSIGQSRWHGGWATYTREHQFRLYIVIWNLQMVRSLTCSL